MMNLLITTTLMFMFLKHPLSLGLTILFQTISITLISGKLNNNFWFSYILFLILIGGMMIIFIYMTSIASNEKFQFSMKMMISMILIFSLSFLMLKHEFTQNFKNFESNEILPIMLNKYINSNSISSFFMIITYLLISLIVIVNMTSLLSSPLRQMN
uniref:NADH-ubiquinone oxidoreductase chain 6 n=1 Tax=Anthribidae sp. 6 ACP-2013 TaxID=1434433 RepID=A0A3G5FNA2_9CUCU|nr:NADH dehydrogenase subunit 6 [Anthribidae sp. 6 ACP-2013]